MNARVVDERRAAAARRGRVRAFAIYGAPALAWAGLIFAASGVPGRDADAISRGLLEGFSYLSYVLHAAEYLVLGVLILRGLNGWRRSAGGFGLGRLSPAAEGRVLAVLAAVLALLYGFSDEFHQSFVPGRVYDLRDVAADLSGALAGIAIARLAASIRARQLW